MIDMPYPWIHHEDDLQRFPSKCLVSLFVQGFLLMPSCTTLKSFNISMHTGKLMIAIIIRLYPLPTYPLGWDIFDSNIFVYLDIRGARPSVPWASAKELNAWNWPRWLRPHQLLGTSTDRDDMGPGLGYKPGGIVKIKLVLLEMSQKKGDVQWLRAESFHTSGVGCKDL